MYIEKDAITNMSENIFRNPALVQKKKGDRSTSDQVKIFKLPTQGLLIATLASATAGIVWSCLAQIPIDFSGSAVVIDVDEQQDVVAGGTGRLVLIERGTLKDYQDLMPLLWKTSNNPNIILKPKEIANISKRLLTLTNFREYERLMDHMPTEKSLEKVAQRQIHTEIGFPIALIFSDDARTTFTNSLKKNFEDYADAESRIKRSKGLVLNYKTLLKSQNKIVSAYSKLRQKNYVSRPDFLQQKNLATQYVSQISSSTADLEKAEIDKTIALQSLMLALNAYASASLVVAEANGYVNNMMAGQGSYVSAGSEIFSLSTHEKKFQAPNIIVGLVDATASNFVAPGDRVVATPLGVNKAAYGGMKGAIKTVVPYGEDKDTLSQILGINTLASQTAEGKSSTPNLILIDMERTPNKQQYLWTSSNTPLRKTRLGDVLTIAITAESKTPLELAIPFIKSTLGFSGPTTFPKANK